MGKIKPFVVILLIICITPLYHSKKVEDLFNGLYTKDIYSGYLETGNPNHSLFYIFTPSQSDTPQSDPVILWLHGGPGCSALDGFLVEMGPVVTEFFTGQGFHLNEFAWNKNANVLFLESPAGVGFSINKDEVKKYNDQISSTESVYAVGKFFEEFPMYKDNEFYVSGFSYSGINVPYFVKAYYEQKEFTFNIKGVFIGNGLTSFESDVERSMVHYGYGHGLISQELMDEFERNCPHLDFLYTGKPDVADIDCKNDFRPRKVTKRCNEIRDTIRNTLYGIEIYGIYAQCRMEGETNTHSNPMSFLYKGYDKIKKEKLRILEEKCENIIDDEEKEEEKPVWPEFCGEDEFVTNFLNNSTTKEKLGVDKSLSWIYCDFDIFNNYVMSESFLLYKEVLIPHNLKIWHFSGDGDLCVSTLGTMHWIDQLNLGVKTEWRQWHVKNQVAGYVQEYNNNFVLITFKGAGHFVPLDRREESFIALNGLINSKLPE